MLIMQELELQEILSPIITNIIMKMSFKTKSKSNNNNLQDLFGCIDLKLYEK